MKLLLVPILLAAAAASQAVLFDNFSAGAYDSGSLTALGTTNAWQNPSSAIGGTRFVTSTITANPNTQIYRIEIDTALGLTFVNSGVGVDGTMALGYGFANGSTAPLSAPLNLNSTASPLFRLTFTANDLPNNVTTTLYSSTLGNSVRSVPIPGGIGAATTFTFDFTGEANLADVDSILFSFNPATNGDFSVGRIESVPEPASLAVIGVGLFGILRSRRKRSG